ncbi:MAG: hypothetical protein CMN85_04580 [Spongiibacteraceae bacterium]|nr:hypothetical protein [Spongiibacteraceae bacterium]
MLHTLHRVSACVIGAFVAVHLLNHLLALESVDAHIAFMEAFRNLYRIPLVEILLLACVAFQIASGIYFIKARWGQRRGFFERLQALSGGYLAYFLLAHVGAVLFARTVFNLDTNFNFAAAGIHVSPFQFYFVPYYFLAVVAIFGHVACAIHWLTRNHFSLAARNRIGYAALSIGAVLSALIVAALAGGFYEITIPAEYTATFGA